MAWIESHQGLERHPKTLNLASMMNWDVDTTLGKLHRFWWWCVDYAPDGDLRRFNDATLAKSVGVAIDDAGKFVDAMVTCGGQDFSGFIDREPCFRVHDWWDYFGIFLQIKFKKNPGKWQRVRALYKGGNLGEGNGEGGGERNGDLHPIPTNLTNQPNQPNQPERTEPPTPLDLLNDRMDLETFVRIWWGAKEGNLSYPILVQMVQLGNQYGKDKLGEAIIQAARQNVRRLAYVQGILRPKGSESPVERAAPRTAKSTAIGEVIPRVLKHPCVAHPETLVGDDELCPKCFPMCDKCRFQHAADESCDEWKTRLPGIKKTVQPQ